MSHPRRAMVRDWPAYLKAFRTKHDLSQKQLADHLMVSRRLVENWEGSINVPPAYLKLTLKALEEKLVAEP